MKTTFEFSKPNARARSYGDFLQSIDQSEAINRRDHILSPNRNREFSKYQQKVALLYRKGGKMGERNEVQYSAVTNE